MTLKPNAIIERICSECEGVHVKASWGETSLFYNPGKRLPNGVYFCTIKEKDGDNDKSSQLNRDGVYRLSIGTPKHTYHELFGEKPKRPAKGCIVHTGHDFCSLDKLMPHPIYAWMSWICILSPTEQSFEELLPFILQAHQSAVLKFNKKVK